jgi:hypothetical protein
VLHAKKAGGSGVAFLVGALLMVFGAASPPDLRAVTTETRRLKCGEDESLDPESPDENV